MKSNRRPLSVTLLAGAGLIFSALQFMRVFVGLRQPELPLSSIPGWYLPFKGALWGACGLTAVWFFWRGKAWSAPLIRWGGVLFVGWYWFDRLFFGRSDYLRISWPLNLLITLLGLGLLFWCLSSPKVQTHLMEKVR